MDNRDRETIEFIKKYVRPLVINGVYSLDNAERQILDEISELNKIIVEKRYTDNLIKSAKGEIGRRKVELSAIRELKSEIFQKEKS